METYEDLVRERDLLRLRVEQLERQLLDQKHLSHDDVAHHRSSVARYRESCAQAAFIQGRGRG